ncbi:hypothetical protein [Poriferisphaera sp. WC338]|uniref:hypothetical protein n=1 Tax=Poriferisphaera sp. WC338 TaxID=3425129 RepID=UPI003D8179E4
MKKHLTGLVGIAAFGLIATAAQAETYRPIADVITDGTLFEDAFSSSDDYVGTARSVGHAFTIGDENLTVTELLKVTDSTGANETIELWDVTNNQVIYSLDTTGTSFDWVTYELDTPIELLAGNQYALVLHGEANTNYREADLEPSSFGPDGFVFLDDALTFDYGFSDRDGWTGFGGDESFNSSNRGFAGVLDIGIDFDGAENPVAVPTPAAFGLGGMLLGLMGLRRKRE